MNATNPIAAALSAVRKDLSSGVIVLTGDVGTPDYIETMIDKPLREAATLGQDDAAEALASAARALDTDMRNGAIESESNDDFGIGEYAERMLGGHLAAQATTPGL